MPTDCRCAGPTSHCWSDQGRRALAGVCAAVEAGPCRRAGQVQVSACYRWCCGHETERKPPQVDTRHLTRLASPQVAAAHPSGSGGEDGAVQEAGGGCLGGGHRLRRPVRPCAVRHDAMPGGRQWGDATGMPCLDLPPYLCPAVAPHWRRLCVMRRRLGCAASPGYWLRRMLPSWRRCGSR